MTELAERQLGRNYEVWSKSTPEKCESIAELISVAIDRANLAPSSHNSQPWKFTAEQDSLIISPDLNRRLEASDPTDRQMYISVGTAIANAKVTARYYGWQVSGEIIQNPDGTIAEELSFFPGYEPTEEDKELFEAINKRVSNRRAHTEEEIPDELVEFIHYQEEVDGRVQTHFIRDREGKMLIGTWMHSATGEVLQNIGFRAELSRFVEPNYTNRFEGMPAFGFGAEKPVSDIDSIDFSKIVLGGFLAPEAARQDLDLLANKTKTVTFITTPNDTAEDWLVAGERLEMIALKASSLGFSANVLAGLIEVAEARKKVRKYLETDQYPQVMLRVGKPVGETQHAPRRPTKYTVTLSHPEKREVIPTDRPTIFTFERGGYSLQDLDRELGPFKVTDRYARHLLDLYNLDNPAMDPSKESERGRRAEYVEARNYQFDGVWVYYPWDDELVHLLGEDEFKRVFYSRNNPCILPTEQQALGRLKVAVGGLSVGSNIAVALAKMGVENLAVADLDTVDLSNQSRMAVGDITDIGERKTDLLARQLYGINPFMDLKVHPDGFGPHNIADVMSWTDVYVDHMDNLPLKIEARKMARVLRKIILMATDIDKRPLIDLELPDEPQLFNGRGSKEVINQLTMPPKSFTDWCKKAVQIFGFENTSAPVLENFVACARDEQNYGSQLGLTGNVVSGLIAYYVYEIARGNAKRLAPFRIIPIEQEDLIDQERLAHARQAYEEVIGQ